MLRRNSIIPLGIIGLSVIGLTVLLCGKRTERDMFNYFAKHKKRKKRKGCKFTSSHYESYVGSKRTMEMIADVVISKDRLLVFTDRM